MSKEKTSQLATLFQMFGITLCEEIIACEENLSILTYLFAWLVVAVV